MRRILLVFWMAILGSFGWASAEDEIVCAHYERSAESERKEPKTRRYAPSRTVDVVHLVLDVTPDFRRRTVSGIATVRFQPIGLPVAELRLDAVDLTILDVDSSVPVAGYDATDEQLVITFAQSIKVGSETTVTIRYEAEPKQGLKFKTPELGYPATDEQCWTQGEPHEARHWFPSFDYPNERFTSEMVCHVPTGMTVLSNGRQVSEDVDAAGLKVVRWMQDKPHVNYLIALAAGYFEKLEDDYNGIPLGFYVPPTQFAEARHTFDGTKDMMAFFEKELGVPYPWDTYNQVITYDHGGGMENTTLTTLTERTLFRAEETERLRSSRGLLAHELAHQWFGDYLTCKDWSHIWLNEGFATFYDGLHRGHVFGNDYYLHTMVSRSRNIVSRKGALPIVYREYVNPGEQFDFRAYPKGSWVLHMLRVQLGEDLYRRCITTFVERHALQSVVTEDLVRVVEEISGRSFDQFFDQWVYHGRHPELTVSYAWQEKDGLAKVTVAQTQTVNEDVLLFNLPTQLRFVTDQGVIVSDIVVAKKSEDFYVSLPAKPTIVRFDPQYGILGEVTFKKPTEMLYAQLRDTTDVVGRLLAVEGLKSKTDLKTIEKLKSALNEDSFYGVQVEASKALGEIGRNEAFDALVSSRKQPDERVRQRVIQDIGRFYRPDAAKLSRQAIDSDTNSLIRIRAIENLGKHAGASTRRTLVEFLDSDSYRNELASAAVRAIQRLDDAAYSDPLMKTLARREAAFTRRGFGRALESLGRINRFEERKHEVRTFLGEYVNHKNERIQRSALTALGNLEDPQAIPIVSSFAGGGDRKTPVQRSAESALKKLREARKTPVEVKDLRSDVEKLKEQNEKMEKALEDLKKRLDAREETDDSKRNTEDGGQSTDNGGR